MELSACFAQLEERECAIAEREKQIGTSKPYRKAISQLRKQHFDKISRRRLHLAAAQIPQMSSTNSPSPPNSPLKTSLYAQLDGNQTKSVIQPGSKYVKKSRHRRVGSGSSMNVKSIISRDRKQYESDFKTVETQTQTDINDLVKKDEIDAGISNANPSIKRSESTQKKNLESSESSNESDIDESNRETTSSSQVNDQAMANSMATSIMTGSNLSYDTEEMYDKKHVHSDDDNLENLRRKVNELIIETASNIDSYSTNSSTNTIINKNNYHSQNCEANAIDGVLGITDDFVDSNKNIKSIKCSCEDDKKTYKDNTIDDGIISGSDEEFSGPKKFNHSLRMKR